MKLQQTTEIATNHPGEYSSAAPQTLRFYIHDHSHAFRLQLIGSFTGKDIPELDGCWNTASRSVAERKVCVDLLRVTDVDDVAREWLMGMSHNERVEFITSPDLASELPLGGAVTVKTIKGERTGRWQALLGFLCRDRRPSVLYEVAATDTPSQSG